MRLTDGTKYERMVSLVSSSTARMHQTRWRETALERVGARNGRNIGTFK